MCIMGICELQLGRKKSAIRNKWLPRQINFKSLEERAEDPFVHAATNSSTALAKKAMSINDSVIYPSKVREEILKKLFLKYGHELEFINNYKEKT